MTNQLSEISIWTIYDSPADYPGKFVARKFVGLHPTAEILTGNTLEEVRTSLPSDLACIARSPEDPPSVVESWL